MWLSTIFVRLDLMVIILKQDVKIDSKFNLINLMLILKHDDYGHMSSFLNCRMVIRWNF